MNTTRMNMTMERKELGNNLVSRIRQCPPKTLLWQQMLLLDSAYID
jgi:hypothetical protein